MAEKQNPDVEEQGSETSTELQTVDNKSTEIELKSESEKKAELLQQLEKFTANLNKAPNPAKVVKHKQGYLYIPISVVEKDLDKMFFGLVQYEVLELKQIFNEMQCTARIKVYHPILNQWLNYDGVGSAVIQQDAETKVVDFHLYKKANALKLASPIAFAEAKKNAAKQIGKRFGADLNRTIEDDYVGFFKEEKQVDDDQILNK